MAEQNGQPVGSKTFGRRRGAGRGLLKFLKAGRIPAYSDNGTTNTSQVRGGSAVRTSMIDALFVDHRGRYPERLGTEHCWDERRDARTYAGTGPIVAHPPCHLWVNLAAVNWKRYGRQLPAWYPGGSDGGCFESALSSVLRCGGVLEHPAFTHAWEAFGLTRPSKGPGWVRAAGGYWVCEVWQSAYGHLARKRTWLLYSGSKAPAEMRWDRSPGTHQIGWFDRGRPTLGKRAANATPEAFAEALIELAWSSR